MFMLHVFRFRPTTTCTAFFVRFGSGKPITNPTKELDCYQKDFGLPLMCSSNARHVVETMKGSTGIDETASAVMLHFTSLCHSYYDGY